MLCLAVGQLMGPAIVVLRLLRMAAAQIRRAVQHASEFIGDQDLIGNDLRSAAELLGIGRALELANAIGRESCIAVLRAAGNAEESLDSLLHSSNRIHSHPSFKIQGAGDISKRIKGILTEMVGDGSDIILYLQEMLIVSMLGYNEGFYHQHTDESKGGEVRGSADDEEEKIKML